ncbi:MAG: hypothetical protein WBB74_06830 [Gaiellaceae bacterium]
MKRLLALFATAAFTTAVALLFGSATPAAADGTPQLGVLATLNLSTLIPADDPIVTDPAANDPATTDPAHLPPGGKFKLFGTAKDDTDPENPFNEVISFDTTDPNAIAGAIKLFGDHVKIDMLDNQVETKYYYVGRTCGGGSTRIQLGISGDGDSKFNQFPGGPDQNAFGYLGNMPFGGGCLMNQWVYEDMTNNAPKWDLSQYAPFGSGAFCTGGNPMTCTWAQMEAFLDTVFPNHRVLNEVLVDDSGSFFAPDRGCAYFDLLSAGARTLTRHDDTSGNGTGPNNC